MNKLVGLCLPRSTVADLALVKDSGVEWLRTSFRFPFKDPEGSLSPEFLASLAEARRLREAGFRLLGTVPGPGSYRHDPTLDRTVWKSAVPDWLGTPDQPGYRKTLEEACAFVAREAGDLVEYWQIANEPDVPIFRGPLTNDEMVEFLFAAARGVRRGRPEAAVGINVGLGYGKWLSAFDEIYNRADSPFRDGYVGVDGYLGCWSPGSPADWARHIDDAHRITGRPVIINEWGYSSLHSAPKERERDFYNQDVCRNKTWTHSWGGGHDPEIQAEFVKAALRVFTEHPQVLGHFFFRWDDTETCWQCGERDCPSECAWGMVDTAGRPKPVYHAFREIVRGG